MKINFISKIATTIAAINRISSLEVQPKSMATPKLALALPIRAYNYAIDQTYPSAPDINLTKCNLDIIIEQMDQKKQTWYKLIKEKPNYLELILENKPTLLTDKEQADHLSAIPRAILEGDLWIVEKIVEKNSRLVTERAGAVVQKKKYLFQFVKENTIRKLSPLEIIAFLEAHAAKDKMKKIRPYASKKYKQKYINEARQEIGPEIKHLNRVLTLNITLTPIEKKNIRKQLFACRNSVINILNGKNKLNELYNKLFDDISFKEFLIYFYMANKLFQLNPSNGHKKIKELLIKLAQFSAIAMTGKKLYTCTRKLKAKQNIKILSEKIRRKQILSQLTQTGLLNRLKTDLSNIKEPFQVKESVFKFLDSKKGKNIKEDEWDVIYNVYKAMINKFGDALFDKCPISFQEWHEITDPVLCKTTHIEKDVLEKWVNYPNSSIKRHPLTNTNEECRYYSDQAWKRLIQDYNAI